MEKVQELMNEIQAWSDATFGNGQRTIPILYHLKKEVPELIEALKEFQKVQYDDSIGVGEYGRKLKNVTMEFADCMMLLLDAASHHNIHAGQLFASVQEKLEINKKRNWGEPDENGVVEHIKE